MNTSNNNNEQNHSNTGYFSNASYLKEKETSMRTFFVGTEYDILKDECYNELPFKILQNSVFNFNVINKENKALITYNEIKIKDYNDKISIEEVKNISSENKILNDNYKRFISTLNEIEKKIKDECKHNIDFKIILKFSTIDVYNLNFIIRCDYYLEISDEKQPITFKDENILDGGLLKGLQYLINKVNEIKD